MGGVVWYVKDNHLVYENNFAGEHRDGITSSIPLPTGKVVVAYEFTKEDKTKEGERIGASGVGRLYIDGKPVGESKLDVDSHAAFWGSFGIGQAFGSPVSPSYPMPFKFTGRLDQVAVELK